MIHYKIIIYLKYVIIIIIFVYESYLLNIIVSWYENVTDNLTKYTYGM